MLAIFVARTSLAGESERLAAESLFSEARGMLARGEHDAACAKFAASQKLDPSVGAMVNLAECAVRRGETATAWLLYRDAAALASRKGDLDRERGVLDRAAALEVPRRVVTSSAAAANLVVRCDAAPIEPVLLGVETPINPGRHVIDASAPGFAPWRTVVEIPRRTTVTRVDVPALAPLPSERTLPGNSGVARRNAALVVAGGGVLAAAVGGLFGLRAASSWGEVTDVCPDRRCPDARTAEALDTKREDALRDSVIATGAFTISVVALAAAAWLYWGGRVSPFDAANGAR